MKHYQLIRILPFILSLGLSPQLNGQDVGGAIVVPSGGGAVQSKPPMKGPILPVPKAEIRSRRAVKNIAEGQTCSGEIDPVKASLNDCPIPARDGVMNPEQQSFPAQGPAIPLTPFPESLSGR